MKKTFLLALLWAALAQAQQPIREFTVGVSAAHPSRVIVKFRSGPSFLPGSGASHALGANLHVVDNPRGLSVAEAIRRYKQNPNVLYAEPDYLVHTTATPTDPMWSMQWDMVKISAPAAWNTQTNASDVIVAVVDTGVDFTHPDLQGNLWTNGANGSHGFSCIDGTCLPGGQDDHGHGTHVAGTIGAVADNGRGIAGINWRAQILACKFMDASGNGTDSDAILCFNQLMALKQQGYNIRVANNSWGGGGYSQALKDTMSAMEAAGILNVCAAGNSGVNADLTPMYPAGYNNRGILSVLATDQSDLGASFTNYGVANVDLAAPGVSTVSTVPMGTCSLCDATGYRPLSGTSMAAPHVTGVAAAIFHLNPSLSAVQARDILLDRASYDAVTDWRGSMSSTGGRLNFQKAIANPLMTSPRLNGFPAISPIVNAFANAGSTVSLTAAASDPDNDLLRMEWATRSLGQLGLFGYMAEPIFPAPAGNTVSFQAPAVARTVVGTYAVSVADGRGGSHSQIAYATIQPSASAVALLSGSLSVSPASGPVGTNVTVSFPVTGQNGPVAWDLWQTSGGIVGSCCLTGSSAAIPFNTAGAYRIGTQAIDRALNISARQTAVVRIGGATGTPPLINATFDKLSGAAPLTVNVDMTGSTAFGGTLSSYTIICQYMTDGMAAAGPRGSCTYNTPGVYWMLLLLSDSNNLADVQSAYIVVTPAGGAGGGSKQTATVTLSNLTQTYNGTALKPAVTTNPPGLAITWTNAPQTNAGTYAVTATVNDANYEGSASGTFTINKATASVTLGNLTQSYTGSALTPTATTSPAGLAIQWTNAPQANPGSYSVVATVNNPNYQGSASGTFTITGSAPTAVPPSATITSPVNGATVVVKSAVAIQAAVTTGTNPVARVDFLVNGNLICTDTAAPYSCSWNVPGAVGKTYQLQVKAYDTIGTLGASGIVSVRSSR
jgi:subtilisin family serine protease